MSLTILIQNVTLIDGTGREPLPQTTVAMRDGKIIYVGKSKQWQVVPDEDVISLDFSGRYLLPGLIDSHVHLSGSGEADSQFKVDNPDKAQGFGAMTC